MPFDIAAIADDVARTLVIYGDHPEKGIVGHVFAVRYRPSKYSDEFHRAFTEKAARDSVNYYLTELLVSWELTSGGVPIPLTPEGMAMVILPVKLAVVKAIEADVVNPTTSAGSPDTLVHMAGSSNGGPPAGTSVVTTGLTAFPIGSA